MKKLLLFGALAFLSCKKEGCTDPLAINYNSEANKENGTCLYRTTCIIDKVKFYDWEPLTNISGIVYKGDTISASYVSTESIVIDVGWGGPTVWNELIYNLDNPTTVSRGQLADSITILSDNNYFETIHLENTNAAPTWSGDRVRIASWLD